MLDRFVETIRGRFSRPLQYYGDICVRCGACADKCHYYIGTGDPKNMPVLRAELLRSVYRNDFTRLGKMRQYAFKSRQVDGYDVMMLFKPS